MSNIFKNKKIVLGITGSIAAYKAVFLARELVKLGADVSVILTPSAAHFVSELTISNLTRNKVIVDMFDKTAQSSGAWHIELSHNADLMIIAPCSATTLSKLANGNCDTSLVSVAIAKPREIPLLIAPAMDTTMYLHPAVQRNIEQVRLDGAIIIPPAQGALSSGLSGEGRLPDFPVLLKYIEEALKQYPKPVSKSHNSTEVDKEDDDIEDIDNSELIKEFLNISDEPLQSAIDKDKWNAEMEFTELKKKQAQA